MDTGPRVLAPAGPDAPALPAASVPSGAQVKRLLAVAVRLQQGEPAKDGVQPQLRVAVAPAAREAGLQVPEEATPPPWPPEQQWAADPDGGRGSELFHATAHESR